MGGGLESGDDYKKSEKVFSKEDFKGVGLCGGDGDGDGDGVLGCGFFCATTWVCAIL